MVSLNESVAGHLVHNSVVQNDWKISPDNTVQVVDPLGSKKPGLSQPRNWTSIWVSLVIIGVIIGLIALAVGIIYPMQATPLRRLCLSDLSDPDLIAEPSGFQWISDEEIAYASEFDGILALNTTTRNATKLLNRQILYQTSTREFEVSSNHRYILLTHDIIQGRLFTRTAQYSIYDIEKTYGFPLKLSDDFVGHQRFQFVQWIHGNCRRRPRHRNSRSHEDGAELISVYENNIYYMSSPRSRAVKLTESGKKDLLFNGIPDIVYEEILQRSATLWINACGTLLSYISFNDTNVVELPILEYPIDSLPTVKHLRYATVNTPIPEFVIWIYDLNLLRRGVRKKWSLKLPFVTTDHYLLGVGWSNNSQMWISSVSRDQSTTLLATCSEPNWDCEMIYSNYQRKGISPLIRHVVWTGSWAAFPWPENPGRKAWHNQVVLVGIRGGKPPPLTLEKYNVKKLLASSFEQTIYFLGSKLSNDAAIHQLYRLSKRDGSVSCLSCKFSCNYVNAELNPTLTYVAIRCMHLNHPSLHLVSLRNPDEHFNLHTQPALREKIVEIALPIHLHEEIDISPNIQASVILNLPPDWKIDDETFLFPLLIQIAGIENLNLEDETLRVGWSELLPSGYHVAHAKIRLSGNDAHKSSSEAVSYQMATVIKYLLDKYPFLDRNQVFGWGWGSGASFTLQLSSSDFSVFKCIALINPVYDWKYYASFWSERLLGSLATHDGRSNYEGTHLQQYIEALNVSHILLVQSTVDPLSHHSVMIAESLLKSNIDFTHVVYPDRSLSLLRETRHLLKTLLDFFLRPECVQNFYVSESGKRC